MTCEVRGGIDGTHDDGRICGWAWQVGSEQPTHVRITWQGRTLAEAIANCYRLDLLRASMGLGYCGFYARLRFRPPVDEISIALHDVGADQQIGEEQTILLPPAIEPAATLLPTAAPPAGWSDDDLLENLAVLDLGQHCARLGYDHFIDAVFRYVLGRWVEASSLEGYARALRRGDLSPDAFFAEVLTSEERKRSDEPLPDPYDYRFPFRSFARAARRSKAA